MIDTDQPDDIIDMIDKIIYCRIFGIRAREPRHCENTDNTAGIGDRTDLVITLAACVEVDLLHAGMGCDDRRLAVLAGIHRGMIAAVSGIDHDTKLVALFHKPDTELGQSRSPVRLHAAGADQILIVIGQLLHAQAIIVQKLQQLQILAVALRLLAGDDAGLQALFFAAADLFDRRAFDQPRVSIELSLQLNCRAQRLISVRNAELAAAASQTAVIPAVLIQLRIRAADHPAQDLSRCPVTLGDLVAGAGFLCQRQQLLLRALRQGVRPDRSLEQHVQNDAALMQRSGSCLLLRSQRKIIQGFNHHTTASIFFPFSNT